MQTVLARTRDDWQKRQQSARLRNMNSELRNPVRYAYDTARKLEKVMISQGTKRSVESGVISGRDKVRVVQHTSGNGAESMFRVPGLDDSSNADVAMLDAPLGYQQRLRSIAIPHKPKTPVDQEIDEYAEHARMAAANAALPGMSSHPDVQPPPEFPGWFKSTLHGNAVTIPGLTTLARNLKLSETRSCGTTGRYIDENMQSRATAKILLAIISEDEHAEELQQQADCEGYDEAEAGALSPLYEADYGDYEDEE